VKGEEQEEKVGDWGWDRGDPTTRVTSKPEKRIKGNKNKEQHE
jgi:hypothetical protein